MGFRVFKYLYCDVILSFVKKINYLNKIKLFVLLLIAIGKMIGLHFSTDKVRRYGKNHKEFRLVVTSVSDDLNILVWLQCQL